MAAAASVVAPPGESLIKYEKLQKMHLCVGLIREARREPEAQLQMYRLVIDLGPLGQRHLTSVITGLGPDEPGAVEHQLIGRQVIVGCRIEHKEILGQVSEGVVLSGYRDPEHRLGSFPIFISEAVPLGSPIQ